MAFFTSQTRPLRLETSQRRQPKVFLRVISLPLAVTDVCRRRILSRLFTFATGRIGVHTAPKCDIKPIRYVTLHFRDRLGAASLRHRSLTATTVLLCEQKPYPVWFSWRRKLCPVQCGLALSRAVTANKCTQKAWCTCRVVVLVRPSLPLPSPSWLLNPLSRNSDQHQFSSNNIHTPSRDKVMRINKMITKEKIPWSFVKFSQRIL